MRLRTLPFAATAIGTLTLASCAARSATIITYGQTAGVNTVTGTANATGTHFSGTDIAVTITQIDDADRADNRLPRPCRRQHQRSDRTTQRRDHPALPRGLLDQRWSRWLRHELSERRIL